MNTADEIAYSSPLGPLLLRFSERGLCSLQFAKATSKSKPETKNHVIWQTLKWLDKYFAGNNPAPLPFKIFDLERGTFFQKQVWLGLTKIPQGQVVSYSDLARSIRNPKACRAVGSANGRNPIPIIIPCHRVITTTGTLGGYSCGLDRKKRLLKLEGISL